MKKTAFIAATAAAIAGAVLLFLYQQRFEEEVSGGPPVRVLVARRDIPLGTPVTEQMLGVQNLPQSYVEGRHIRANEAKRIVGVRVSSGVRANESILWTDLATSEQRRDLSGLVRNGMRAITIRADVTSSFGGLLRPGDRVDVLLTAETGQERSNLPLMQNLLVLAVGADTGGIDQADNRSATRRTRVNQVTLSVSMPEAQQLSLAQDEGRLSLVLRNPDDITIVQGMPRRTGRELLANPSAAATTPREN